MEDIIKGITYALVQIFIWLVLAIGLIWAFKTVLRLIGL